MANSLSRREFMDRSVGVTAAGVLAGLSLEDQTLLARTGAPEGAPAHPEPVTGLPRGRIGNLEISRLICGGNLFSGFAHSRDLIYVSAWMKHYFTPDKIMDTLQLCEENGINTAILRCDDHIIGVLDRYRKERGGTIQWVAQTYPKVDDLTGNVQMAIDNGAVGAFVMGGIGDDFYKNGRVDLIGKVVEYMQRNGIVAGVGSHMIEVTHAVEEAAIAPDFYFKTLNDVGYNSEPPATLLEMMRSIQRPWIAFKVLGAGLVKARPGLDLAFRTGADFINLGMFDFQVRDDAAAVKALLAGDLQRARPWVG